MARKFVSKIGGQAVLEGVMMRGEKSYATAVRASDGNIVVETGRVAAKKAWTKIPILRGVLNFFSMLVNGTKITMRSAEVFGEELEQEEPNKFEKWLAKNLHIDVMTIALFFGVVLGLGLSVFLFFMLPTWITGWITQLAKKELASIWFNLIEGGVRIIIFVAYMLLTSLMKEIRRLYQYHGAEHKTISCFEAGLPLTVENARTQSKHHDRCGTNFIVIVMLVSILLFSLIEWLLGLCGFVIADLSYAQPIKRLIRIAIKLAVLPLIAGVSYELLKFLAHFDNIFSKILKAPGMLIQHITTREPDDTMLEVAIKAFTTVQEMDADSAIPTVKFKLKKSYAKCRESVLSYLSRYSDKEAKADWIFTELTGTVRSELPLLKTMDESIYDECVRVAKEAAAGKPLQYAVGHAYFYGYCFNVDSRVLIPRQDTEILAEKALEVIKDGSEVLDLCTGSGCLATVLALKTSAHVTAADISAQALEVAGSNFEKHAVQVKSVQSDMFTEISQDFDVIVCNPPYISQADMLTLPEDVKQEPSLALFGGTDGLDFYRRLAENPHLIAGGVLLMEIGDTQAQEVCALFKGCETTVVNDLGGANRVVIVRPQQ